MVTYEEIAEYTFMAFVVIAIIAGLAIGYMAYDATRHWNDPAVADANGYVTLIMLILGIIVGLISITAKEVGQFLIAAIALMVTRVGLDVWEPLDKIHGLLHYWATGILNYIVAFVAPAAVIISIKSIWVLARKK
jgi:hypothetical protein